MLRNHRRWRHEYRESRTCTDCGESGVEAGNPEWCRRCAGRGVYRGEWTPVRTGRPGGPGGEEPAAGGLPGRLEVLRPDGSPLGPPTSLEAREQLELLILEGTLQELGVIPFAELAMVTAEDMAVLAALGAHSPPGSCWPPSWWTDEMRARVPAAHHPPGFAWGYIGSRPVQLALALLLDRQGAAGNALWLYKRLERDMVARWSFGEGWTLPTLSLDSWISSYETWMPRETAAELRKVERTRRAATELGHVNAAEAARQLAMIPWSAESG